MKNVFWMRKNIVKNSHSILENSDNSSIRSKVVHKGASKITEATKNVTATTHKSMYLSSYYFSHENDAIPDGGI